VYFMIYANLFNRAGSRNIRAGLIGTGSYGISLLAQAQSLSRLEFPVVYDQNIEKAQSACRRAGIPAENITVCGSRKKLLNAMENGKCAIAENHGLLLNAPLDVVVECTGNPEAGARHAISAIRKGKHVAMVNKETDAVIGPILHKHAGQAGVIYTPVDGDQHGLLIGLITWAHSLGLEVVCGGKARPVDFIYDESAGTVTDGQKNIRLPKNELAALETIGAGGAGLIIGKRRKALKQLPQIAEPDLCEMVIAANATGLTVDTPSLHAPVVRTTEIPEALSPKEEGGILGNRAVAEVITCLRRADEAGLGGGVFVVFSCDRGDAWKFVRAKGLITNQRGSCGVVYRPYHLLGVETPVSILCAGLLNISTGSLNYKPRVDLIARATRDIKAGTTIHAARAKQEKALLKPLIVPATAAKGSNPLPLNMAYGNRIRVDVPAGSIQ
jgi:predicted homoserine dehydrogenase-like protein